MSRKNPNKSGQLKLNRLIRSLKKSLVQVREIRREKTRLARKRKSRGRKMSTNTLETRMRKKVALQLRVITLKRQTQLRARTTQEPPGKKTKMIREKKVKFSPPGNLQTIQRTSKKSMKMEMTRLVAPAASMTVMHLQ